MIIAHTALTQKGSVQVPMDVDIERDVGTARVSKQELEAAKTRCALHLCCVRSTTRCWLFLSSRQSSRAFVYQQT